LSADSSASIPAKPAKKLKKEKIVDNELQPALSVSDITNDENVVSGTTEESSNSFEPLVEARAVKFTGSREIEQLDGNAFKFRLSRGQVSLVQFPGALCCLTVGRNVQYLALHVCG